MLIPVMLFVAAMVENSRTSERLSQRATRLFTLAASENGGVEYPWLSDTKLLRYGNDSKLHSFDIATKRDTTLEALTRQVTTSPAYIVFLDVSPTGDWVMWGKSGGNPIFAAPIDGSTRLQWPGLGGMTSPYWHSDGKRIAQFAFSSSGMKNNVPVIHFDKADIRSVDAAEPTETIQPLPDGLQGLDILAVVSTKEVIARIPDKIEGMTAKQVGSSAFTFTSKVTPAKTQEISVWDLQRKKPLHRWSIVLPGQVSSVAISPNGRRAAWLVSRLRKKRAITELWVSNIDGSSLREVGWEDTENYTPLPTTLNWSPSGKLLSYVAEDALWVTPTL